MDLTRPNPNDPDSPLLTEAWFAVARPFEERHHGVVPTDVVAVCVDDQNAGRKEAITLHLSLEVVEALHATGPDWDDLANELLRKALEGLQRVA